MELREKIAKWLFENKHIIPNQRFYARWGDEIEASPYTKEECLKLADKVLELVKQASLIPELPVLSDKEMYRIAKGCYALSPGNLSVWKTDDEGYKIACSIAQAQRDDCLRRIKGE